MWKFKGIFTKEFNVVTFINFFLSMNFTTFFLFPLYIKNLGGTESDIGVIMGASGIYRPSSPYRFRATCPT